MRSTMALALLALCAGPALAQVDDCGDAAALFEPFRHKLTADELDSFSGFTQLHLDLAATDEERCALAEDIRDGLRHRPRSPGDGLVNPLTGLPTTRRTILRSDAAFLEAFIQPLGNDELRPAEYFKVLRVPAWARLTGEPERVVVEAGNKRRWDVVRVPFERIPEVAPSEGVFLAEVGYRSVDGTVPRREAHRYAYQVAEPPADFELTSAGPSPFTDRFVLRYELPAPASVELTLYNAAGQEVLRASASDQHAGANRLDIEADHLASGVYGYRLRVRTESERFERSGSVVRVQ